MSHSPGPWNLAVDFVFAGERPICDVNSIWDDNKWDDEQTTSNGRLIACAPDLLAIARRVHAECGPEYTGCDYICESCKEDSEQAEDISHDTDCLWLAAEAVLTKAGAI